MASVTISPYFSGAGKRTAATKAMAALTRARKRTHVKVECDTEQSDDLNMADGPSQAEPSKTVENSRNIKEESTVSKTTTMKRNPKAKAGKNSSSPDEDVNVDNSSSKAEATKSEMKKPKSDNWEPLDWQEVLANLKEMRKEQNAPVDSQGCERASDPNEKPQVKQESA